jgi:hypothetical protein
MHAMKTRVSKKVYDVLTIEQPLILWFLTAFLFGIASGMWARGSANVATVVVCLIAAAPAVVLRWLNASRFTPEEER